MGTGELLDIPVPVLTFRPTVPVFLVQQMEGQGIGLYRCWHFVKLNNGKIWVTSVPGKGSEFTVVFPKKIKDHKG
jgi:sensor histidine kinase regulating citrate/malate metabolism